MCMSDIDRRRRRKPGDINSLRRTLWAALTTMEGHIANPDPNVAIRAAHALATLSGSYLKAIELADVVTSIREIEAGEIPTIRQFRRTA